LKTSTLFKLGSGTMWFCGSPLEFRARTLIEEALRGFHSLVGAEYRKLFLKQGDNGPLEFPGMQVLD